MKENQNDKVRLSIGTKLITIISIIVILSLGSITALVSWMVREDLKIAAEENNFEANRRAAEEAEEILANMRAASGQLMYTINALSAQRASPLTIQDSALQSAADFFFAQNPRAAAFTYTLKGARNVLVNKDYFSSGDIDQSLAETYFNDNEIFLSRAAQGETALLNAAPVFTRPVLALFFPYQMAGGQNGAGCVLIASDKLVDSFGSGTNQSFLINDKCDLLIHSDFALLLDGANAADFDFIRGIQEAPDRNKQQLINADFNFDPQSAKTLQYYTAFTKLA